MQGELNITEEIINNNAIQRVSHGMCQDFFEFREVQFSICEYGVMLCHRKVWEILTMYW